MPHHGFTPIALLQVIVYSFTLVFSSHLCADTTVKYTYDALGRLTFVEDPNGNRDYDYDKAGNRLLVAVSTANDQQSEPSTPSTPTGLSYRQVADCYYSSSWNAVAGASHYIFRDTQGAETSVTSNSFGFNCPTGNSSIQMPYWVQACNAIGCSAKAYF